MERALLCVPKFSYFRDQYRDIVNKSDEARESATKTAADELWELEKELNDGVGEELTGVKVTDPSYASRLSGIDPSRAELASANSNSRRAAMMAKRDHFSILEVQYNPKSLSFSAASGKQVEAEGSGMGAGATTNIRQNKVSTNVVMNCELVFEDMLINDAFTEQTYTDNLINGIAQKAVNEMTKSQVLGSGDKYHSVQKYLDGLMALLVSPFSSQVMFYWSGMCFRGQLVNVSGSYTMFNPAGEPVRAVVNIRIRQRTSIPGSDEVWDKAFNKVFKEDKDTGLASKFTENTNNKLINLNL